MKIKILLLLFLSGCVSLQAQETYLSITGGFNSSYYSGIDSDSKGGYQIGVVSGISLSKCFFIEPGLHFISRNSKYTFTDQKIDGNVYSMPFNIESNSLQLPVLAGYRLWTSFQKNSYLLIKAGPYISYGLSGNRTARDVYFDQSVKIKTYTSDFIQPFDFGLKFDFTFFIQHVSLHLGIDKGLININRQAGAYIQTNMFWTSLGYNFYLK